MYFTIYIWKKKVIFFHSRRAEQTFTRIWLLDQLLGVDQPLPLSSLPTTRHVISRSPALGTLLYTPHSPSGITFFFFFFWWSYRLSSDINFFFPPHPHSLSQLTLGGKKYRRSPGHQASSSFYQHLIHHCSFFFSPCRICGVFNICNCFFVKRNSQRKTQLTTQERKDGSHVSHGHCEAFLVLGSPEVLTPRRYKHSLKP